MSPATARQAMPIPPPDLQQTAAQPAPRHKVLIRNVDFYYGAFKALKNVTMPLHDRSCRSRHLIPPRDVRIRLCVKRF